MKSYAAPWEGRVVLACKKCQKKMKKQGGPEGLGSLKKAVKRRGLALHVVPVGCMDFCPKGAVAVCVPGVGDRVVMVRGVEELDGLQEGCFGDASG